MPRRSRIALLLPAAVALAGCGIHDPYSTLARATRTASSSPHTTTAATASVPDHDGPRTTSTGAPAAGVAGPTPQAALERYANLYINWRSDTIRATERQLAQISEGQARAQALAGAAKPPGQLQQYQVRNAGTVVAIAPGQASERGKWAVVCNERTTGTGPYEGLPAVSEVIWATTAHTHQGWVVSGWYPAGAAT